MDPGLLLHQALLFAHVIAFAMTVSAVLREDLRWLRGRRIDAARLRHTQRTVTVGLTVLWATGLALWALVAAASPLPWGLSAKLGAKLAVVGLLTLNGWALHAWAFPKLLREAREEQADGLVPALPAVLGAISSASWVFAAFVGVARPLAGVLSLAGFMALYAAALAFALCIALLARRRAPPTNVPPPIRTEHRKELVCRSS